MLLLYVPVTFNQRAVHFKQIPNSPGRGTTQLQVGMGVRSACYKRNYGILSGQQRQFACNGFGYFRKIRLTVRIRQKQLQAGRQTDKSSHK